MAELSQQNRLLQLQSGGPIATTDAVATRFVGSEGLSRPFRFVVDLLSTQASVSPASVVGKELGVMLFGHKLSKDVTTTRLAHGVVARWTELGPVDTTSDPLTHYRAELVPWLSLLGLSAKTRTYEEKAVDAILTDVFEKAGFKGRFKFTAARALKPRPYTVQYAETDLAFVSRLLEEEGLYYTFEFLSADHVLTISDKSGSALTAGTVDTMPFAPVVKKSLLGSLPLVGPLLKPGNLAEKGARTGIEKGATEGGAALGTAIGTLLAPLGLGAIPGSLAGAGVGALADLLLEHLFTADAQVTGNAVTEVQRDRTVHTQTVSAHGFHLLRPDPLAVEATSGPGARGDYFEFLGDLAGSPETGVGDVEALRQMGRVEAVRDVIRGATTNVALQPGTRVKVKGGIFGRAGTELHVIEVGHAGESQDPRSVDESKVVKYVNEFTAIPVDTPYLPPRVTPRPSVRGTQTAQVVGEGGVGGIDTDKNGCVLLMFPWDQGDGAAQKSKHRVHVASYWAGVAWGSVHWPRVGQLVLVEFLEGNVDRPIVTGRVYSHQHPFPYDMPANKTQSGTKSRTLDGGADNFNELRFEDKKGSEHVFLQAEKDLQVHVKNDETWTTGHDRTETIQRNHTMTLTEGDQLIEVKKGNQTVQATEGDQLILAKKGKQTMEDDEGDQVFLVKQGNRKIDVKQGNQTTTISGTDQTDADTIKMTAKTKIELKCGGSTITMTTSKIEIGVGSQTITIDTSSVKVAGAKIEISAMGQLKASGAMVDVTGSGMAKVGGPMVQVAGDGMLKLAGGVIMAG